MPDPLSETQGSTSRSRTLATAVIGTFIEYYDFALYGLLAPTIATVFFPSENETTGLLATFGVFAVGFIGRPLGGLVFSHFGDRFGRRNVLSTAILLMTACTVAVGLLPSFATIGVAAPVLLVVLRLLQNFSVGGEFSGAASLVVEHAPADRRGLHGASINVASVVPFIAAIVVVLPFSALLDDAQFDSWGWRVPFLIAGPVGLVGLYLRLRGLESPAFEAVKRAGEVQKLPVATAIRTELPRILLLFTAAAVSGTAFYMLSSYMVTHLTAELDFERTSALTINAVAVVVFCVTGLSLARLSDRIGRRPVLLGSQTALFVLGVPAFGLMATGNVAAAVIGQCLFAFSLAGLSVMTTVLSVELFSAKVRYSSNALGYQGAYMVFAGTAPFIATWLVDVTGSTVAPAVYASGLSLIALFILGAWLPETHRVSLWTRGSGVEATRQRA